MQYQYDATTGKLNKVEEKFVLVTQEDLDSGKYVETTPDRELLTLINDKLDTIVRIFKELEARVKDVDARVEAVEGDAQEYYNKVEDLQYTVDEVKEQIEDFDLDNLTSKVEDVDNSLEELKDNLRNV